MKIRRVLSSDITSEMSEFCLGLWGLFDYEGEPIIIDENILQVWFVYLSIYREDLDEKLTEFSIFDSVLIADILPISAWMVDMGGHLRFGKVIDNFNLYMSKRRGALGVVYE